MKDLGNGEDYQQNVSQKTYCLDFADNNIAFFPRSPLATSLFSPTFYLLVSFTFFPSLLFAMYILALWSRYAAPGTRFPPLWLHFLRPHHWLLHNFSSACFTFVTVVLFSRPCHLVCAFQLSCSVFPCYAILNWLLCCRCESSHSVKKFLMAQLRWCYLVFRDTCIVLLKSLPSCENLLFKSCARCQGTVTEVNELHEKVTGNCENDECF